MIINLLYVALGGACGASFRFIITSLSKFFFPYFPLGTLLVNISGCFVIGLLANYIYSKEISDEFVRYFVIVGMLGSFTTFSAFSIETMELLQNNKLYFSILYIFLSVFLCLIAAYLGFYIKKLSIW